MRKIFSTITAFTIFASISINNYPTTFKTNAASYRTTYKIYGDLNNDNKIDIFDVISMRKEVGKGTYNKSLDFNCDNAVDSVDLNLLNGYVLGENVFFDSYLNDDADADNLSDIFEITLMKTDPDSKDTDGDTLSDFEEVIYTGTSPTSKYTRGLAVTDADDDPDEDNLTNKEEIATKTDPQSDDSDMDGINDYDELNKYNTDPNNEDTDNDGISDADEIKLGLMPNFDKSDGQTPDNQRIIEQIIPADSPLLSDINTDDNAYNLSLIINASGCADSCLSVNPSGFAYVMKDGSAIGEVPALQYNDDFTVKDITLKFEIKEAFRDNVSHYFDTIDGDYYDYTYTVPTELDGIKRLNIFKYFEDVNLAMPIETLYDTENNIVYTKITQFETDDNGKSYGIGSYSLVDLEVWSDIMNSVDETSAPKPQNAPMPITLDSNYSILGNEDASIVKTLKELIDSIRDAITKTYESYQVSNNESDNRIRYISLFGHKYACFDVSQIDWAAAEAKCEKMGGHLMTVNTPMELSLLNESLSEGKNGGFYWLGASGGSSNWSWVTGESTSYAKTVKVSGYDMDHCRNYFSYFGNKLAYVPHLGYLSAGTPSTSKIKGYICEWENGANTKNADGTGVVVSIGGRKITLNGMITASSGYDTDHDGVSDYDEVDVNAIKKIGGSLAQTITWKQGHDYLHNKGYISDESYDKIADLVKDIAQNQEVYPTKSNPADVDTDGDGLTDEEEDYLDTKPINSDTDGDGLSDSTEVDLWFDPTNANPDGDSYNDKEELANDTSPFVYNKTAAESSEAFLKGGALGDFDTADSIEALCGQIAGSFVPFAADARDYIANVFVNLDTKAALLNLGGFLLDFVPGVGASGDAAKAFPKIGRFIGKYADDAPKVAEAIIQGAKHFPESEDVVKGIAKVLPAGAIDDICDSIKNGSKLTKKDYDKLLDVCKAAGKNADEVVEATKFSSFRALKEYLGDPGKDKQWHHIVEQCQAKSTRSGFDISEINKVSNVKATPNEVHKEISKYYSSHQPFAGEGKTVRDWLNGQSYEKQYEFGMEQWKKFMKQYGYSID